MLSKIVKQQYEGGKENLIKNMSATQEVFIAVGKVNVIENSETTI
jgi:hypothetical protein